MAFDPEDLDQPTTVAQVFKPRGAKRPGNVATKKDTDGDTVSDAQERRLKTNIRRDDSDDDGLSDAIEVRLGTNPNKRDTDGDGNDDGLEAAVAAASPRVREPLGQRDLTQHFSPGRMGQKAVEKQLGVKRNEDSDGNGIADWIEVMRFRDPKDPNDFMVGEINNDSPLQRFVYAAEAQVGKPYQRGAEADPNLRNGAPAYDKGELVEWAARQAGVGTIPDGSSAQYELLNQPGTVLPLQDALALRGALVFGLEVDPATGKEIVHVAISIGNGKVIDVNAKGVFEEMDPKPHYTRGAVIPELHLPKGDIDGDGESDLDEYRRKGDISEGKVDPLAAVTDVDQDGIPDDVDPDVVDPRGGVLAEIDPVTGQPLGGSEAVSAPQVASLQPDPALRSDAASADPLPPEEAAPAPPEAGDGGEQFAQAEPTYSDTYDDDFPSDDDVFA